MHIIFNIPVHLLRFMSGDCTDLLITLIKRKKNINNFIIEYTNSEVEIF